MGSSASKPSPEELHQQRLEEEERERCYEEERKLREFGIFCPPIFGVGTEPLPASSARLRLPEATTHLETLERDLVCSRILHDHMTPGLWISATSPLQASVLASTSSGNDGVICGSQHFSGGQVNFRADTSEWLSASANYQPIASLKLDGMIDSTGQGWFGCATSTNVTGDGKHTLHTGSRMKFQPKVSSLVDMSVCDVTSYAAINSSRYTMAMEGTLSRKKATDPDFSYYVSCDLSGDGGGPPLVATMLKSPTKTAVSLSQVLTFDRRVLRSYDGDLPNVRNTAGWAVQMEKQGEEKPQLKAGLAWQLNRGLAVKLVANPSDIKGAVLLKRWKEPRVTCSLIFGLDSSRKIGFHGIGVEVGTGQQQQDYYNVTVDGRGHVGGAVPATKQTLPNNTSNQKSS